MRKLHLVLALAFASCVSMTGPALAQHKSELDDDDYAETAADPTIHDPWESMNRGIFWFNDQLDIYLLEPVARGYDTIMPDPIQQGVGNFFSNLRYPSYLLSDLVQLKGTQAVRHTGRFVINTIFGVAGFIDVAKHVGLEHHKEDFGIALAYHNVPPGPYFVIPILGPSNVRDTVGIIVDSLIHPFTILSYTSVDSSITTPVALGGRALELIDTRSDLLDAYEASKSSALDYYLFMQSAYYQHRRGLLYDGKPPGQEGFEQPAVFEDDASGNRAVEK